MGLHGRVPAIARLRLHTRFMILDQNHDVPKVKTNTSYHPSMLHHQNSAALVLSCSYERSEPQCIRRCPSTCLFPLVESSQHKQGSHHLCYHLGLHRSGQATIVWRAVPEPSAAWQKGSASQDTGACKVLVLKRTGGRSSERDWEQSDRR